MSEQDCAKLAGMHLAEESCGTLVEESCDVYCSETGKTLAKFRKAIIPADIQTAAYKAFKPAATKTSNRGTSAGWNEQAVREYVKKAGGVSYVRKPGSLRFHIVYADKGVSKTSHAVPVESGVVGFMDASQRFPYCRQTAFNAQHLEAFKRGYPIIKFVDDVYRRLMPEEYARQKAQADATPEDWVIPETAFTTVTVNRNWQTAVHQDAGDFRGGFGNLVALRAGEYKGGHFVLPRWGVGFDLQNGDVLLVDVHEWHGNTPIVKVSRNPVRISLVMYYREKMIHCGTAEEEIEKARNK